jgi:DNA-directed RNA polymerase specialized sigma24 family protein
MLRRWMTAKSRGPGPWPSARAFSPQLRSTLTGLLAESPAILTALRVVLGNDAEADDVLGATLEIALWRGSDLRNPDALRAWLIRIAIREAFRLGRVSSRGWQLHGVSR